MKKVIALLIPLLTLLATAVLFITLESRRTPDWQQELNEYLVRPDAFNIQSNVSARHPENFKPDIGAPAQNDWPWGIETLPYPPKSLRCILLAPSGPSETKTAKQQILYLGYYNDTMWRAGWLVHEGPQAPFPPKLVEHLSAVGCDLKLK